MKKSQIHIIIVLLITMVFSKMSVLATDTIGNISAITPINHPRDAYVKLFENNGIDVPSNALLGITSITSEDGSYDAASMVIIKDNAVAKYVLLEYYIDNGNNYQSIDVHTSLNMSNNYLPNGSTSGSKLSITATAYYNQKTGSGGNRIYQPYKLTFVSNGTRNAYLEYQIRGDKHNASTGQNLYTQDTFTIARGEYPAYSSQLYSTTNTAPYYYSISGGGGQTPYHRVYITVAGTEQYFAVTSDST